MKRFALALALLALVVAALWMQTDDGAAATGSASGQRRETNAVAIDAVVGDAEVAVGRAQVEASEATGAATPAPSSTAPAPGFEVEVVDAAEQPVVGVEVRVLALDGLNWSECWLGTTDESGHVRIDPVEDLDEGPRWPHDEYLLGTASALATPRETRFRRDDPPTGVVRLQLEPTCSIELVVVDSNRRAVAIKAGLLMTIDDRQGPDLPRCLRIGSLDQDGDDGAALFTNIGLELPWLAFAYSPRFKFGSASIRSPARAGATLRVELPITQVASHWRGRVLDRDGEPLRNAQVEIRSERTDPSTGSTHAIWGVDCYADGAGRFDAYTFAVALDDLAFQFTAQVHGQASLDGRVEAGSVVAWVDTTDFDRPLVDFGDVRLSARSMLASGRVVDAAGASVSRANIEVRPLPNVASARWTDFGESSDNSGRFVVSANVHWPRFELRASRAPSAPGPAVAVDFGATDVTLVVSESGAIAGQLLLPDSMDVDDLDFDATHVDPTSGEQLSMSSYETGEAGGFLLHQLAPGEWTVRVLLGESELAARERVAVRGGERTNLEPIDLRPQFTAATITVLAPDGAALTNATVIRVDSEDALAAFESDKSGQVHILALAGPADFVVRADGYRPVRLAAVVDGVRVVLEPGIRCTFEWPPDLPPLHDGELGSVFLHHTGATRLARFGGTQRFDIKARTSFSLRLPLAGEYDVQVRTLDAAGRSELGRATFEIADDDSNPTVVLPID